MNTIQAFNAAANGGCTFELDRTKVRRVDATTLEIIGNPLTIINTDGCNHGQRIQAELDNDKLATIQAYIEYVGTCERLQKARAESLAMERNWYATLTPAQRGNAQGAKLTDERLAEPIRLSFEIFKRHGFERQKVTA